MNINFWWAPVRGQTGGRPNFIDTRYMAKECHLACHVFKDANDLTGVNIIRVEYFAEDDQGNVSQVKFERDDSLSAKPFEGVLRAGERNWVE